MPGSNQMRLTKFLVSFALVLSVQQSEISYAQANDCKQTLVTLNQGRSGTDLEKIRTTIEEFKSTSSCSDGTINMALNQTAAVLAQQAQDMIERDEIAKAEDFLSLAPATHWLVLVTRADIAADADDRSSASYLYNAALDTILNENMTPNAKKLGPVTQRIAQLAQENTMLSGTTGNLISRSNGQVSGVYAAASRGLKFVPDKRPSKNYTPEIDEELYQSRPINSTYIPIKFATDSDQLDESAIIEAQKLAMFINSYHVKKIKLIGHTDERGSDVHNQDLSERRAHTLKSYLQTTGKVIADIITTGLGENSPPVLSDYNSYTTEQRQSIARRVELVID
jgi:outer membrane protein OmpA-like peptidoglycan-associated protein